MKNRARKYIAQVRWQNAKTYEKTAPHEYTIRKWKPELNDEFIWFESFLKQTGYVDYFWGYKNRYVYIDGHRYWGYGDHVLINRCISDEKQEELARAKYPQAQVVQGAVQEAVKTE